MVDVALAALMFVQPGAQALGIGACAAGRTVVNDQQSVATSMRNGARPDAAIMARISDHVRSCTPPGASAPSSAVTGALGYIAQIDLRSALTRAGISADQVDAWFARQSEARRTSAPRTPADGQAIAASLAEAGVPQATMPQHAGLISRYLGAKILIERIRRGLPPAG